MNTVLELTRTTTSLDSFLELLFCHFKVYKTKYALFCFDARPKSCSRFVSRFGCAFGTQRTRIETIHNSCCPATIEKQHAQLESPPQFVMPGPSHPINATATVAWLALLASAGAAIVSFRLLASSTTKKEKATSTTTRTDFDARCRAIETHLRRTQKPARALDIRVVSCTDTTLTLSAPLCRNHNVHGTAFCGSLYSLAALASYYLARDWLQRNYDNDDGDNNDPTYHLVGRAGSIRYLKAVTSVLFEATSTLPADVSMLETFREDLRTKRKAIMSIDGEILQPDTNGDALVACRYSIEVCAYYG
jgi:thioesterase domain-containing protein